MSTLEPGKIVTFYSYKGGSGRSMAVANVAWILASNGKRVLVIDWDLEAPGLHRFFAPFLLDRELTATDGVIDFVRRFETAALTPPMPDQGPSTTEKADGQWYERLADLGQFAVRLNWDFGEGNNSPHPGGLLDFVSAGRQGPFYSERVNSFDWHNFYARLGGGVFLEATKRALRRNYDYILIDSRTGVSDTSGVCTVQLPQILVVLFTANNQSIEGAANVLASIRVQRRRSFKGSESELQILPVLSRVDVFERDKLEKRRELAKRRFTPFLDTSGNPDEYWGRAQTLYVPFYAYEEVLSVFKDDPNTTSSMLWSMVDLTNFIAQEKEALKAQQPPPPQRQAILADYAGTSSSVSRLDVPKEKGSSPLLQQLLLSVASPFGPTRWQDHLSAMVKEKNNNTKHIDYRCSFLASAGLLIPALAFLAFLFRRWLGLPLERRLLELLDQYPNARLVLVAHGMGTLATVWALERIAKSIDRKETPPIHTLILSGCPLRPEFTWDPVRRRGLVARVVNECGTHDAAVVAMAFLGLSFGLSGRVGFSGFYDRHYQNRFHRLGHTGYFKDNLGDQGFMRKYWMPLLTTNEAAVPVDEREPQPSFWSALLNQRSFVLWLWAGLLVIVLAIAVLVWRHRSSPPRPLPQEVLLVGPEEDWLSDNNNWLVPVVISLVREGKTLSENDKGMSFRVIRLNTPRFTSATTSFSIQVKVLPPHSATDFELRGYAFRLRPAPQGGSDFVQSLPLHYGALQLPPLDSMDKARGSNNLLDRAMWPVIVPVPQLDKGDSILIVALLLTKRMEGFPPDLRQLLRMNVH
jgi:cellulose biosynthesis protein BcsQ/pimeloyl-ACP methyl ester carboxylesterase